MRCRNELDICAARGKMSHDVRLHAVRMEYLDATSRQDATQVSDCFEVQLSRQRYMLGMNALADKHFVKQRRAGSRSHGYDQWIDHASIQMADLRGRPMFRAIDAI